MPMKSTKVQLLKAVTFFGSEAEAGAIVEVNATSAAALIRDGAAQAVEVESAAQDEVPTGAEQQEGTTEDGTPGEEIEQQKKALDAQYKKEELAEAAKKVGVEFHYDAKKSDIIDAVIAAGKVEVLMK